MATITVTCSTCNTKLVEANGPLLGQADVDAYQQSCSCNTITNGVVDGPVQTYDENGNPLPMNSSNIVVVLTNE